jgi:non-ribosomal peptide synthetase component F
MYHIIGDGISNNLLQKEFMQFYAGHRLPRLRLQYKDFSEWQNSDTVKAAIKQQEEFWLGQFDDEIPVLNLQADFNEVDDRGSAGSSFNFIIDREQTKALKAMVSETDATLYILLLAIYYVLLSKLSGQEDIIVGSPAAGRRHPDLEYIVGMFVNMLTLRNYPKGKMKFKEFLEEVRARFLDVLENQDYPFDDLVAKIGRKRDTTGNQLFDVVFQFDEADEFPGQEKFSTGDTHLPLMHALDESFVSPFALTFIGNERDDQLHFKIEYSTSLFKPSTIEEISDRFVEIVKQVTKNEDIKLEDITISHGLLVADTNILQANQEKFEF